MSQRRRAQWERRRAGTSPRPRRGSQRDLTRSLRRRCKSHRGTALREWGKERASRKVPFPRKRHLFLLTGKGASLAEKASIPFPEKGALFAKEALFLSPAKGAFPAKKAPFVLPGKGLLSAEGRLFFSQEKASCPEHGCLFHTLNWEAHSIISWGLRPTRTTPP